MDLIVGLGNPGSKYAQTRHNLGFWVVDKLAERWNIHVDKKKFDGRMGGGYFKDRQVILLKPETFMNRSGFSVRAAMDFYKLEPKDLLIIYDDLALPVGQIRIRNKGSAGGHNGLSDVILHAGTHEVGRIRIGIGQPGPFLDAVEYVLGHFPPEEKTIIDQAVEQAANAVETLLEKGYPRAMEQFNRTEKKDQEKSDSETS